MQSVSVYIDGSSVKQTVRKRNGGPCHGIVDKFCNSGIITAESILGLSCNAHSIGQKPAFLSDASNPAFVNMPPVYMGPDGLSAGVVHSDSRPNLLIRFAVDIDKPTVAVIIKHRLTHIGMTVPCVFFDAE